MYIRRNSCEGRLMLGFQKNLKKILAGINDAKSVILLL